MFDSGMSKRQRIVVFITLLILAVFAFGLATGREPLLFLGAGSACAAFFVLFGRDKGDKS